MANAVRKHQKNVWELHRADVVLNNLKSEITRLQQSWGANDEGVYPSVETARTEAMEILERYIDRLVDLRHGCVPENFKYKAAISGGWGPNTWDDEVVVEASSLREAVEKIELLVDRVDWDIDVIELCEDRNAEVTLG